ncbi:MAG TPA: hypothetical protein VF167_16240 [Longimicrobiaceae bacterium]
MAFSRHGRRRAAFASSLLAVALLPGVVAAQEEGEQPVAPDRPTMSDFGKDLSDQQAGALLAEMGQLLEQAIAASRQAQSASNVAGVKQGAAQVLQLIWGIDPQVSGAEPAEVARLGWKERWQVTGAEFDPNFVKRLGSAPPRITDPTQLGIVGRGRAVRARLEALADSTSNTPADRRQAAANALASLNDVIGWTHITRGYKGREVQPRISLTHMWDAPPAFWNSTADTGWLFEAEAQAINIIKTDYGTEVAEAQEHAAAMTALLERARDGVDANKNGRVEPIWMEGGLAAALSEAQKAGLRSR